MIAHDFLFLNWFFTIVFRAVGKKNKIREPVLLLSSSNGGESELSSSLFCLVGWLVVFFFFLFCFFFTTWPPALQLGSKNSIFMFKQKNLTLKDTSALVYINSTHLYSVQVLKRNQIFLNLMQNIHELREKHVLSLFFTELGYKKYFPKYFLISDFQI